jgi:hypothetical protein
MEAIDAALVEAPIDVFLVGPVPFPQPLAIGEEAI